MDNTILYQKLICLPESMKAEVSNFIDFLITKEDKNPQINKPKFGSGKGMFKMKKNFEYSLEEFKDYTIPRKDWEKSFKKMHKNGDDKL